MFILTILLIVSSIKQEFTNTKKFWGKFENTFFKKEIMQFTFYHDPGHGWLRVSKSLIFGQLNIDHLVSSCSYASEKYLYLEEDCDLAIFVHAYKKVFGIDPIIKEVYQDQSHIRNYPRHLVLNTTLYNKAVSILKKSKVLTLEQLKVKLNFDCVHDFRKQDLEKDLNFHLLCLTKNYEIVRYADNIIECKIA